MNKPCQCEKRLLDTLVHLCRSLHEQVDAQLIGELARLLLCNRPLVRPVRLVADEDLVDIFRDIGRHPSAMFGYLRVAVRFRMRFSSQSYSDC
jgi:hypothetical protein